ncbi:MAG: hypothetical protein AVDCRST_MAG49-1557 [uncultured Thermomicrobiales bacterium]|uniref:B3/B4 tRNA-binding domain-containing protein n=1 Tax=uncultured Thermomicrobiales bacterium TaxID=1645740 RepID=A0A6J4UF00_9BACT|nr:MAG: hypothetical protein AVDCRST_MAG49-1557 [uncultured Thermomicrobiales bacterium]
MRAGAARAAGEARVVVDASFWALFPEARIATVVVRGVDNSRGAEACASLLADAARATAGRVGDTEIGSHPAVAPWRDAYRAFGAKPSKYRSSIEGLLRSAAAGRLGSINPLVDIYNAVSLRHLLPCGGEDLGAVRGTVRLTRAAGDEAFVPLGSAEPQPPWPGEVIYRDDAGAICRCWNWREAERTKLSAATVDALLVLEALPPVGVDALRTAGEDLAALVGEHLGGTSELTVLGADRPEARFPAPAPGGSAGAAGARTGEKG